jgi:UDP-glucose 4-epimerase
LCQKEQLDTFDSTITYKNKKIIIFTIGGELYGNISYRWCRLYGSHTVVELLNLGKNVVIVDNLSNSSELVLERIANLVEGDLEEGRLDFYNVDIRDEEAMDRIIKENTIDAVIHFAGLKAVGESVTKPLDYYDNNITGTLVLLKVLKKYSIKKFVFSSSATVYGLNNVSPLVETLPLSTTNPYGSTKLMIEQILTRSLCASDHEWSIALLRYFNPIGAHQKWKYGRKP